MTTLSLLIDNDIVIKLAKMDAYLDALACLGVSSSSVGSLGVMLRYMGRTSEQTRLRFTSSQAEASRLATVLYSIAEIEPTEQEVKLAARLMKIILQSDLDLDEGEVTLMAVALERMTPDVATGDKRALRALPDLATGYPALCQLRERLICFEQVIKRLCKERGLARVRAAVLCARLADRAITATYDQAAVYGATRFTATLDLIVQEQVCAFAPGWLKKL